MNRMANICYLTSFAKLSSSYFSARKKGSTVTYELLKVRIIISLHIRMVQSVSAQSQMSVVQVHAIYVSYREKT